MEPSLTAPLGALEIVRSIIAFALFLFLPGWLFVSAWLAKKDSGRKIGLPETVAASLFASITFLALLSILLAFTVGVGFYSVLFCEIVLIGGLWFWKTRK